MSLLFEMILPALSYRLVLPARKQNQYIVKSARYIDELGGADYGY